MPVKCNSSIKTMSKTHQARISAYMVALVINLEASKYSETNYNKVISTATHKSTKVKTHKTHKTS